MVMECLDENNGLINLRMRKLMGGNSNDKNLFELLVFS
jgi:hypothetical protein